jgi:Flp pilus assembly pilin Flp
MRIGRKEDGAALVEFALIAVVLFTLLFGIIEFGLAFRDWLSVTSSTREGARVAAAAGNAPDADCAILNAMTGPLLAVPTDSADTFRVFIYKANVDGSMSGAFQLFVPDEGAALNPVACNQSWDLVTNGYPAASRNVTFSNLDTVGVRIEFVHQWVTNLFPANADWTDDSIMRMEPKSFSGP